MIDELLQAALQGTEPQVVEIGDWRHISACLRAIDERLNGWSDRQKLLRLILEFALETPSPAAAINHFERYLAVLDDQAQAAAETLAVRHAALQNAITVFGNSHFLSEIVFREPGLVWWIAESETLNRQRTPGQYRREAEDLISKEAGRDARKAALCTMKRREVLRIGCRDIMRLASVEEITRETSDLAEAIIRAAATACYEEMVGRFGHPLREQPGLDSPEDFRKHADRIARAGMCVIGMGKLGGR